MYQIPMQKILPLIVFILISCRDQSAAPTLVPPPFTAYHTGSQTDVVAEPKGGICLMGGSREDDNAMKWFMNQANGGDILVIRASGSDGYNDYMFSDVGVSINSVTSIVVKNKDASFHPHLRNKIEQAEGIWFAGGNQWKYVDYWKGTPVDSLIHDAVQNRNVVIGGTSAGLAILGEYIFSAENGTVTSSQGLGNPYHERMTIDTFHFFTLPLLKGVITDSHYDERDRQGRHVAMMARIAKDKNILPKGIGIDERTAVTIDANGRAKVFGLGDVYFIRALGMPEVCVSGSPLTWNVNGQALKVYTASTTSLFDLNDWAWGAGGEWGYWSVVDGVLKQ